MSSERLMQRARVFVSCGQTKHSDELETAEKIRGRLQELGFDPYIAVEEQTLAGGPGLEPNPMSRKTGETWGTPMYSK